MRVFSKPAHQYVDRGDPSSADFDENDLDVVDTWTDIDLSSIVPAGAVAVVLAVVLANPSASAQYQFRKNGNTNYIEGDTCIISVANMPHASLFLIPCDENRVIEYLTNSGAWTWVDVTVKGWWI